MPFQEVIFGPMIVNPGDEVKREALEDQNGQDNDQSAEGIAQRAMSVGYGIWRMAFCAIGSFHSI